MDKNIVASLTIEFKSGSKLLIEIQPDASFSKFFRWNSVTAEGKTFQRTSNRNDSGDLPRSEIGLDLVLKNIRTSWACKKNPVLHSTITILDGDLYKYLTTCPTNELPGSVITKSERSEKRFPWIERPGDELATAIRAADLERRRDIYLHG